MSKNNASIIDEWGTCVADFQTKLASKEFDTYVSPLRVHYDHDTRILWVGASNVYVLNYFKEHLADTVNQILLDDAVREIKAVVASHDELIAQAEGDPGKGRAIRTESRNEDPIEAVQEQLFKLERKGQFKAYPVNPQNEFPTLLTRIPIFVPGQRQKQKQLLDKELALTFKTSWGEGRKFGPPLSIYDEDTLLALGKLRQTMLIGEPQKLPKPVSVRYTPENETTVRVHTVACYAGDIDAMCGVNRGGQNRANRLASIRRLAGTKIEFSMEVDGLSRGTVVDLIHVDWSEFDDNSVIYVQFSPTMVEWLENAYTYINFELRTSLKTDIGKSVYRFLASQPKTYTIGTKKLQQTIGDTGVYKRFMLQLRQALDVLKEQEWLEAYEISGNGRTQPHKLQIVR